MEKDDYPSRLSSYANPFAVERTTEKILIQREKERMKKMKREHSLS
jgi:hypothetical protein